MKIENIKLYRHYIKPIVKAELEYTAIIENKKIILFKDKQQENKIPKGFHFWEEDVSLKQKEFKDHTIKIELHTENIGVANPPFYTNLKYIDRLKLKWMFGHGWFRYWGEWDLRLNVISKTLAILASISAFGLSIYTLQTNEKLQTQNKKTIDSIGVELGKLKVEIFQKEQTIKHNLDTTLIPKKKI